MCARCTQNINVETIRWTIFNLTFDVDIRYERILKDINLVCIMVNGERVIWNYFYLINSATDNRLKFICIFSFIIELLLFCTGRKHTLTRRSTHSPPVLDKNNRNISFRIYRVIYGCCFFYVLKRKKVRENMKINGI